MSDLIEKMKARVDKGTPCLHCGATAVDCQIRFLSVDDWCCVTCREDGGKLAHLAVSDE